MDAGLDIQFWGCPKMDGQWMCNGRPFPDPTQHRLYIRSPEPNGCEMDVPPFSDRKPNIHFTSTFPRENGCNMDVPEWMLISGPLGNMDVKWMWLSNRPGNWMPNWMWLSHLPRPKKAALFGFEKMYAYSTRKYLPGVAEPFMRNPAICNDRHAKKGTQWPHSVCTPLPVNTVITDVRLGSISNIHFYTPNIHFPSL